MINESNGNKAYTVWGDEELRIMLGELELHDPKFKRVSMKDIIKDLIRFYLSNKDLKEPENYPDHKADAGAD